MADPNSARAHLEHARDLVWDAAQLLEEAQRVLFHAGDRYVDQVWGDGVNSVIELTERITEVAGDLGRIPSEIGRLMRRDRERGE